MDKDKDEQQGSKLPMYYEQIYSLMKAMAKLYIQGQPFVYRRVFKQFYSRIRPELSQDRKEYYDKKIEKLGKNIPTRSEYYYSDEYREKAINMIRETYEIEMELFEDIESQTDIFKVLKHNKEMELI